MHRHLRSRQIGATTLTAVLMAIGLATAAPSGAAAPAKEYSATLEPTCVIAPGIFNIEDRMRVGIRWTAPPSLTPGESFELTRTSLTLEDVERPELTESFVALGIHEVRGAVDDVMLDTENLEPGRFDLAWPPEFPGGVPFHSAVHQGKPFALYAPSLTIGEMGRVFSYGPLKVTGAAGQRARFAMDPGVVGIQEVEAGYRYVTSSILAEFEGFNEEGNRLVGPLQLACPGLAATIAEIPIVHPVETAQYANWPLTGSITDKRLSQPLMLPEGSVFNGTGELNTETGQGSVKGAFTIPPFNAQLKLLGVIPLSLGVTLSEQGTLEGTVTKSESGEVLTMPAKLGMGITSVKLVGLTIPAKCVTTEALALNLTDRLTAEELLRNGMSFSGTTAIPKVKCEGGLLGSLFGTVLTGLLSGPENSYALEVTAP